MRAHSRPKTIQTTRATPAKPNWALWFADSTPSATSKLHVPGVIIQSVRAGSFADLQGLSPAW